MTNLADMVETPVPRPANMSSPRGYREGLLLAAWTFLGLLFGAQLHQAFDDLLHQPISWGQALATTMPHWYAWGLLAPLVVRLGNRIRLERLGWLPGLQLHLVAALFVSLTQIGVALGLGWLWVRLTGVAPLWPRDLLIASSINLQWNFLTYWAILGLSQGLEYYRRYQEEGARAAGLEARLAEARLEALRLQLHPHFLFNTLNSISALMHEDVEAADAMLTRLSELLRYLLDQHGSQEVPLRQELEFLERYLKIEQARFPDRLRVRLDVAPDTLDARVPAWVLQPIVENAVRHGIAARPGAGRLSVRARRDRHLLRIEVEDDGPGMPGAGRSPMNEGVGLGHTRARLEQLYGGRQELQLQRGVEGGLLVRLSVPFDTLPAPRPAA